jgi:hypothetical protein
MRIQRFVNFLQELLARSPEVESVTSLAEAGITDKPIGLVVTFPGRQSVFLQMTSGSPPGGERPNEPERIVEGDVLPPVEVPSLPRDRIPTRLIEAWLRAIILSGGSPEIAGIRSYSLGEGASNYHKVGLTIDMYSGRGVAIYFLYTVRPGDRPISGREYQVAEYV